MKYSIISVLCGFILGSLLSLAKFSKKRFLVLFADFYTLIFRGTPVMIQLSIIYLALPIKLSIFAAGIIAFSLNSSAYISEIIKSGILAIEVGQFEAAKALGISYANMMKDIIIPQAMRNISPALLNEFASMSKESCIISMFGELDIMHSAQNIAFEKYTYFAPMVSAAICYFVIVFIASYFEKLLREGVK